MNVRSVLHILSFLLLIAGGAMGVCFGISAYCGDPPRAQLALNISSCVALLAGLLLKITNRGELELSRKDGFAIVSFGWLLLGLFGAVPYVLSGVIPDPVGAVFETVSGFTTTGASVMSDVESAPKGILFWRALTQWLGGVGVLVLCLAILPFIGSSGMKIFQAEVAGPTKDRLTPKIAATAKLLWGIYALLTFLEILFLRFGGMGWFDSTCHSFATLATGGFSTRNISIEAYRSPFIEWVVIAFMFLGGVNFALFYRAIRGNPFAFFRDTEFRWYLGILAGSTLIIAISIFHGPMASIGGAVRAACFQSVSSMTTTGFSSADFDRWPPIACFVLMTLMFVGGCAGSTAGAIKVQRLVVVFKAAVRHARLFLHPQAIIQVKLDREVLDSEEAGGIVTFIATYLLVFVLASVLMTPLMPDLRSSVSAVVTTLGNVGPGLGAIGPYCNYSAVPAEGKLLLTFCMLVGRLELFTVFVLFLPSYWKK